MIILFTFNEEGIKNKYILTLEQTKLIYILSDFDFSKNFYRKLIFRKTFPELYDIPRYYSKFYEDFQRLRLFIFLNKIFFWFW